MAEDDDAPLPDFDKIRSLAAVYYPGLLSVLKELEAPMQERLQHVTETLKTAAGHKSLEEFNKTKPL